MSERTTVALSVETAVGTWIGRRAANEDRVYSDGSTVALFDGIGGRPFGDVAASVALAEVVKRVAVDRLKGECDVAVVLRGADDAVRDAGVSIGVHIGTTAVIGILESTDRGPVARLGWAGDSAALLLRGAGVRSLTSDKATLPADQRPGLATWLGNGEHLPPRHATLALLPGDTLILVSDGITDVLTRSAIGWLVGSAGSPRQAVDMVLNAAKTGGATDNCSIVIAAIGTTSQIAAAEQPGPYASEPPPTRPVSGSAIEEFPRHRDEDLVRTVENNAGY